MTLAFSLTEPLASCLMVKEYVSLLIYLIETYLKGICSIQKLISNLPDVEE